MNKKKMKMVEIKLEARELFLNIYIRSFQMQQNVFLYELVPKLPINTSYIPVSISGNIVHFFSH